LQGLREFFFGLGRAQKVGRRRGDLRPEVPQGLGNLPGRGVRASEI